MEDTGESGVLVFVLGVGLVVVAASGSLAKIKGGERSLLLLVKFVTCTRAATPGVRFCL